MSLSLYKISKYIALFVIVLTGIAIIFSGIVYIVRSTVEYISYLKGLENDIKFNKNDLDRHEVRIKELERGSQIISSKLPLPVKENMNIRAFTKKSLANNLSDDQFKHAIKTIENSKDSNQASTRLQDLGLFGKADLSEIFSSSTMKQENNTAIPAEFPSPNSTIR